MDQPRLFVSLPLKCIAHAKLIGDFDPLIAEWSALLDPVGAVLLEAQHWRDSDWDRVGVVAVSPSDIRFLRDAARKLEPRVGEGGRDGDAEIPGETEIAVLLGLAVLAAIRACSGEHGHEAALKLEEKGFAGFGA